MQEIVGNFSIIGVFRWFCGKFGLVNHHEILAFEEVFFCDNFFSEAYLIKKCRNFKVFYSFLLNRRMLIFYTKGVFGVEIWIQAGFVKLLKVKN
jgi:hypothetical protein